MWGRNPKHNLAQHKLVTRNRMLQQKKTKWEGDYDLWQLFKKMNVNNVLTFLTEVYGHH